MTFVYHVRCDVTDAAMLRCFGCCDATTFAKLVVTSNGYDTYGIAQLQAYVRDGHCNVSTYVHGVGCNVSGIWNVMVT